MTNWTWVSNHTLAHSSVTRSPGELIADTLHQLSVRLCVCALCAVSYPSSHPFSYQALVSLRLCGNQIAALPPPSKWKCSRLRTLDLSRNQLGK